MVNTNRYSFVFVLVLIVTASPVIGCRSEVNTVIQPRVSQPTLEETSDYERDKQEMMSERDRVAQLI